MHTTVTAGKSSVALEIHDCEDIIKMVEYSDCMKGFYFIFLSLPFILLFICWASILCRYKSKIGLTPSIGDRRDTDKSKIIEDSLKISNLKSDQDLEAELFF